VKKPLPNNCAPDLLDLLLEPDVDRTITVDGRDMLFVEDLVAASVVCTAYALGYAAPFDDEEVPE